MVRHADDEGENATQQEQRGVSDRADHEHEQTNPDVEGEPHPVDGLVKWREKAAGNISGQATRSSLRLFPVVRDMTVSCHHQGAITSRGLASDGVGLTSSIDEIPKASRHAGPEVAHFIPTVYGTRNDDTGSGSYLPY